MYDFLADLILIIHFVIVLFIVIGTFFIWIGWIFKLEQARNYVFRLFHLGLMGFILLESMVGMVCPLTEWENTLRTKAGQIAYDKGFIEYWVHRLMFFSWPEWVFNAIYLTVFLLIVSGWFIVKPLRRASS